MRSRILVLVVACAVAIGASSCKKGSSTPTSPSGGSTSSNAVTITIPQSDGYTNSSFAPTTANITVGGTVTWSNRDTVVHTSTSNTGTWSGDIPAGGQYSRAFNTRGTFPYHCTVHSGMTGTVNVQ